LSFRDGGIFRVASAREERTDRVPFLPAGHLRAASRDRSGNLHAEKVGSAGRGRIMPLALITIGAIYAGGIHFDQHLVLSGRRARPFSDLENLGTAGMFHLDHSHLRSLPIDHFIGQNEARCQPRDASGLYSDLLAVRIPDTGNGSPQRRPGQDPRGIEKRQRGILSGM
jgi:hypothetical protein